MADPEMPTGDDRPRRRLSLPGRIFGAGVRGGVEGTRRVAEAAGLDQAAEDAVEDAVVRALESPGAERALERALSSPAVERALVEVLDSELVDRLWARLLASDEAQQLVERIAQAPEIRAAIAHQSVGFIEDLRDQLREVARRLDDTFERIVRRVLFRRRRETRPPEAGAVSRLLAYVIDFGLLNGAFFVVSGLVALIVGAFGGGHGGAPVVAVGIGAWLVAGASYLVIFWSLSGQTPGMGFLGIHIECGGSRRLGLRTALRRLIGFWLAAAPFLLGFLGTFTEQRRRGWQDRIGRTEVLYEPIRTWTPA